MLSPEEWSALRLSVLVGLCAVGASLPAALAVGYGLARGTATTRWPLRALHGCAQVLVDLPLVLPPVVTGYLLLWCLGPRGPVGRLFHEEFGVRLVFTWRAAAVAAAVVSFPLMVRSIRLAFQGVDRRLEMAARGLGAGRFDAFFSISVPLARRGIVAGCVLAFARGLGEFGATIMVLGTLEDQQTIPLAIYSLVGQPGGVERCWRLVVLSIVLACGALAVSEFLERKQTLRESA
ncbi:MAG TPA: molybdate ABC transporter permease subunit [Pirellulales bacterium]|nr:molybdate ABC transporter permease subunit [Pirellulales bacterium]